MVELITATGVLSKRLVATINGDAVIQRPATVVLPGRWPGLTRLGMKEL
jgi:hypothetical protein